MSALTEKVAREHESASGVRCACGHYPSDEVGLNQDRTRHLTAVTEAATRAAVAEEIRETADLMREASSGAYMEAWQLDDLAARIAEG